MKFKKGDVLKYNKIYYKVDGAEDGLSWWYKLLILNGYEKGNFIIRSAGPTEKYFLKIENDKIINILFGNKNEQN